MSVVMLQRMLFNIMKLQLFFFSVCQLAVALNVAPVIVQSSTADSCPEVQIQEAALQSLSNHFALLGSKLIQGHPQCGDGFWYQLVSINMSTSDSQCPDGWVEENQGDVRACGRGSVNGTCQSAFLNTNREMEYTKVCGRAVGYQYGNPDAFRFASERTIDDPYVDGLSITYGFPRQHIWTYAAAVREGPINGANIDSNCPCASYAGFPAPSYLGDNWYCESGNPDEFNPWPPDILTNDALWDGENCEGTCCGNGKSPPWFSVELPAPTNNYIEARICADEPSDGYEDIFIEILEIYIQ